ncbi:hypothetical protein C8R44DRAFT_731694 [Mycena epipterygia]|nr:hypothetical protein C8R44DRAFT_731694 [Mycena epipterygia]
MSDTEATEAANGGQPTLRRLQDFRKYTVKSPDAPDLVLFGTGAWAGSERAWAQNPEPDPPPGSGPGRLRLGLCGIFLSTAVSSSKPSGSSVIYATSSAGVEEFLKSRPIWRGLGSSPGRGPLKILSPTLNPTGPALRSGPGRAQKPGLGLGLEPEPSTTKVDTSTSGNPYPPVSSLWIHREEEEEEYYTDAVPQLELPVYYNTRTTKRGVEILDQIISPAWLGQEQAGCSGISGIFQGISIPVFREYLKQIVLRDPAALVLIAAHKADSTGLAEAQAHQPFDK